MASTIKVDNVQNQPGTNIVSKCGTDVTLGASGDTVALASGASQTGFGRTGTVDWDTSIHTGTVTAATGKGYFVDTTSGGITVNLPAAAVGSIVAVSDYASTAASNNITVEPNGSEKINGVNDGYVMSTAGLAVTLVYADATKGWKSVTGSDADATGVTPLYVTATGGSPCGGAIVCTNYKVHSFTGPGTFCVSGAGNACGSNTVDYLAIAGGGGGGNGKVPGYCGGGGGAGGYRESPGTASGCYTVSPLGAAPAVALPVSVQGYPIAVGGGGAGSSSPCGGAGTVGVDSVFSTITGAGGGAGGGNPAAGGDGGSGGGGGNPTAGGSGNVPETDPDQGTAGGTGGGGCNGGGGGGGATAVGGNFTSPPSTGGTGGAGATSNITDTPTARAGGGGGSGHATLGAGGAGGGGAGAKNPTSTAAIVGTVNTGGGGGGGQSIPNDATAGPGKQGGSGIVVIRYKFQ